MIGTTSSIALGAGQDTGTAEMPVAASQAGSTPPSSAPKAAASPKPPTLTGSLIVGMLAVSGKAQPTDPSKSQSAPQIYICVWPSKPAAGSLNCRSKESSGPEPGSDTGSGSGSSSGSSSVVASLSNGKSPGDNFVAPDAKTGSFSAKLSKPLAGGQYVSVVEEFNSGAPPVISTKATAVGPASQCNQQPQDFPYSDCGMSLSLIGGVEQSAQSASPSATTGFLRVFTRATFASAPTSPWYALHDWGYVRLLGAPTTSSTNGVESVVSNPTGSITTQTLSTIGAAIDYMLGLEYQFRRAHKNSDSNPYSVSLIAGYGGTTPLQANTLSLAYTAPAYGTVECPALYSRFQNQFVADKILLGTTANASTPSCLVNGNSPTSPGATTYTSIGTIGFSNQDRASFLGKEVVGIRFIDRFLGSGDVACGDTDTTNQIGPCERGIVDLTFGQDASITGGLMRTTFLRSMLSIPYQSPALRYCTSSALSAQD